MHSLGGLKKVGTYLNFVFLGCTVTLNGYYEYTGSWQGIFASTLQV